MYALCNLLDANSNGTIEKEECVNFAKSAQSQKTQLQNTSTLEDEPLENNFFDEEDIGPETQAFNAGEQTTAISNKNKKRR